jgi:hypothetical protein
MDKTKLLQTLQRRPAVHQLCSGAYIQEPIWLSEQLLLVPLQALGFAEHAQYTAQYAHGVVGASVDATAVADLTSQGIDALPVVSLVRFLSVDAPASELEQFSEPSLVQGRRILSYTSGNEVIPFALVTATSAESYFRLLPPESNKRMRLGFGNTGITFHSHMASAFHAIQRDEHFEFAISLLHDTHQEANLEFRIARFFNCLECLASKLKAKHDGKSRKAVKEWLGLEGGAVCEACIEGKRFKYDAIEISGRIRDKLFHGVPFREDDLNEESRSVFALLKTHPSDIATAVQSYCERWVNGVSKGLSDNRESPNNAMRATCEDARA